MLYYIDGKAYLLVNRHYIEVKVKKQSDSYTVVPVENGNVIEEGQEGSVQQITVEEVYKKTRRD